MRLTFVLHIFWYFMNYGTKSHILTVSKLSTRNDSQKYLESTNHLTQRKSEKIWCCIKNYVLINRFCFYLTMMGKGQSRINRISKKKIWLLFTQKLQLLPFFPKCHFSFNDVMYWMDPSVNQPMIEWFCWISNVNVIYKLWSLPTIKS